MMLRLRLLALPLRVENAVLPDALKGVRSEVVAPIFFLTHADTGYSMSGSCQRVIPALSSI